MARRLGRRDLTPQTSIRVSTETRDRLKALLHRRLRELRADGYGRQYGEPAAVTMDDVVRELLRQGQPR